MRNREEVRILKARIAVLEGQLAALSIVGVEPAPASWAVGLTRQQASLMGALIAAWPRHLDRLQLDHILPHLDDAADRVTNLPAVIVYAVRRKLGGEVIETIYGDGYRASGDFVAQLQKAA